MKLSKVIIWPVKFVRNKYTNWLRSFRIFFLRQSGIKIGDGCYISQHAYVDLHRPKFIEIGDHVKITRWSMILCYDPSKCWISCNRTIEEAYRRVKIGNNVFIGAHSIVMPGVNIGNNVIIGANSLVLNDIPSNCIAAGSPAKKIKDLNVDLYK